MPTPRRGDHETPRQTGGQQFAARDGELKIGDPLSERVIGCAIEVHRALGPGLLESVYQTAMCIELRHQGVRFERERTIPAVYRGQHIGEFRPDFIIENSMIVELKCVTTIDRVFTAQILTYLRVTGLRVGLLLNFKSAVMREGIKRFVL